MASKEQAMILSICGPLMNRIKMALAHPKKNKDLASNKDLQSLVALVGEQILPQWCSANAGNSKVIDLMHSHMYLLAYKTHNLFFTSVIHTIIDQNWDFKGFIQVLMKILEILGIVTQDLEKSLTKTLESQNLNSASCMKAISMLLRNKKK